VRERPKSPNSLIGMRSYQQVRRILSKATQELTVLSFGSVKIELKNRIAAKIGNLSELLRKD